MRERAAAVALMAFAAAGLTGAWSGFPPAVLLVGFGVLPGLAALGPCRGACHREARECLMEGPAALALATAFSSLMLVVAVLPLFLLGLPLVDARWTLGALLAVVAAVALTRRRGGTASVRSRAARRAEWAAALVALLLVLPAVRLYAGGTVDDWWDLAFVRAYAERLSLSFAEPFLGTALTHPRFAWNGWLVLQALVATFAGAHLEDVQAGPLAAVVCIASISAAVAFARGAFGARASPPVVATVLFFPLWLWGTEALPYFARLHQDKFVVALVFMPVMLGTTIEYLESGGRRVLAAMIVACLAAATVHGVVFAVGAAGVAVCCLVAAARARSADARPRIAHVLAVAVAGAAYPAWQALALRSLFAAEGISLVATDNPVVRAHLWLERLIGAGSAAYVVHPAAVFGPVALVLVPALVLARHFFRERSWAYVAALTVVPCLVIFLPFVAGAAGAVMVPWMLYRIGWLVPVAALAGLAIATLWQRPGIRGRASAAALIAVALALTIPTAVDRVRRDMLEHPGLRERAPRGSEREVYRFLRLWPEAGGVVAPPGFSALLAAMSGRQTVAVSERGTLVFSGDEAEAYRRLRDRSEFFAAETDSETRDRIARKYGVRLAVFRKRFVPDGSERGWLWRATAEGFLHAAVREGARAWTHHSVVDAVPANWRVVLANRDFVVVRTPYAAPDAASREPAARGRGWLDVFALESPDSADGRPVLASIVGYPGSRVELAPVPIAVGMTSRPVWTGGALAWDDGPDAVRVRMDLGTACDATAVTIVPFLRTERREVLEVRVLGVTRRLRALDGEPLTVAFPAPRTVRELEIGVRSLIGEPFALWDLRVHGDPQTCAGGWRPLARPVVPATSVGPDELLRLAREYPNDARAMLGIARRLTAPETRADAEALLRGALSRDPLAAPAWVELGLMLDAEGSFDAALGAYRRALAADSNNAWAYGCLAWAELRASRPVRAVYHAWRASRLDTRYSDAFTIMAAAVRRFGLERVAGSMLRRAIRLDPQRNWPYLELAQMHADAGDTGAAVGVLDSLLEIVPDDAQARQMIAALRTGAVTEPSS